MIEFPHQRVERILDQVLAAEGGGQVTNDPNDPGGETRWGITAATARAAGYAGPMRDLPESAARAIYRDRYVTAPRFGEVLAIDPSLGAELIDTGVNQGPAIAATFLQRWLNAFNDTGERYAVLRVDGHIGDATLNALRAFIRWRGPLGVTALLRGLNASQAACYLDIAEANPSQRRYVFGWVVNRVAMP